MVIYHQLFLLIKKRRCSGPGAGTYTVAKAGLTQISRLAAIELAKDNIRVNTIHPDSVYDTAVWTEHLNTGIEL